MRFAVAVLCAFLSIAPALHAQHRLPVPSSDPLAKIDAPVQAAMSGDERIDVLVLARTQLFAPIGGLEEFARRLLDEQSVAVVPGSAFGTPGWVRLSLAASMDEVLEGVRRVVALAARPQG